MRDRHGRRRPRPRDTRRHPDPRLAVPPRRFAQLVEEAAVAVGAGEAVRTDEVPEDGVRLAERLGGTLVVYRQPVLARVGSVEELRALLRELLADT